MKQETVTLLQKKLTTCFGFALEQVIDKIAEMLDEGVSGNEPDGSQVANCQLTITPKVMIAYGSNGAFDLEIRIPAKKIISSVGENIDSFEVDTDGNEIPEEAELPGMD